MSCGCVCARVCLCLSVCVRARRWRDRASARNDQEGGRQQRRRMARVRQDPEGALVLAREWEAFAHAFNAFVLSSLAILWGATQK